MYDIQYWHPRIGMNGSAFTVALFPEWKSYVQKSKVTQEDIDRVIAECNPAWQEGVGMDPEVNNPIRITWGEWGPEHISVPGNACGLDIDMDAIGSPIGGACLVPHNVDSLKQASLLLSAFLRISNMLYHEKVSNQYDFNSEFKDYVSKKIKEDYYQVLLDRTSAKINDEQGKKKLSRLDNLSSILSSIKM